MSLWRQYFILSLVIYLLINWEHSLVKQLSLAAFHNQYLNISMEIKLIVTLLLLVCSALAEGTITTTNIDFASTYQGDMANLLTRVVKKVDVRYGYVLYPDAKFHQFPDMAIQFQLQFDQEVYIKYQINTYTNGAAYLCTRVLIDGEEDPDFRHIEGYYYHHTNSVTEEVWMKAGKHLVKVEYNTNGNANMDYTWWNNAIFKIKYLQK